MGRTNQTLALNFSMHNWRMGSSEGLKPSTKEGRQTEQIQKEAELRSDGSGWGWVGESGHEPDLDLILFRFLVLDV